MVAEIALVIALPVILAAIWIASLALVKSRVATEQFTSRGASVPVSNDWWREACRSAMRNDRRIGRWGGRGIVLSVAGLGLLVLALPINESDLVRLLFLIAGAVVIIVGAAALVVAVQILSREILGPHSQ